MRKSDFAYNLPLELIAQHPVSPRSASRLLYVGEALQDLHFTDFPTFLERGDLLVFNDTRVIPARLLGRKPTGGRVEILLERVLGRQRALARVSTSKPPQPEQRIELDAGASVRVLERHGEFFVLAFDGDASVFELLERLGHVPLPPYIKRADTPADRDEYQTIYARVPGAVAAPTAGLHFDEALFARLAALGLEHTFVTLHVGSGTFQPLRTSTLAGQRLHAEQLVVDCEACARINATKASGRRIIAVGTTVVRALETAARGRGHVEAFQGETDIFIYPGHRFAVVDGLLTNFHLPQSTLLMLVCAFGGTERILYAYRHAVAQRYRFYSYGDAMFVLPQRKEEREKSKE